MQSTYEEQIAAFDRIQEIASDLLQTEDLSPRTRKGLDSIISLTRYRRDVVGDTGFKFKT